MSYAIYDAKGYVRDVASNYGLFQLRDLIAEQDGGWSKFPMLERLFDVGHVRKSPKLLEELAAVKVHGNRVVAKSWKDFVKACLDADEIVIITDGCWDASGEKGWNSDLGSDFREELKRLAHDPVMGELLRYHPVYWDVEDFRFDEWKAFARESEKFESTLIPVIRSHFARQLSEVEDRLFKLGKAVEGQYAGWAQQKVSRHIKTNSRIDQINIDKDEEAKILEGLVSPLIKKMVETVGNRRMASLASMESAGRKDIFRFNENDPEVLKWIGNRMRTFSRQVSGTTFDEIEKILRDGFIQGIPIPTLAQVLRDKFALFDKYRAPLIARTETISAMNYADLEAVRQSGISDNLRKHWLSARDPACRASHAVADTKYAKKGISIKSKFRVGQDSMVAPGQGSVAGENINCRCTLYYTKSKAIADDFEDVPKPAASPTATVEGPASAPVVESPAPVASGVELTENQKNAIEFVRKIGKQVFFDPKLFREIAESWKAKIFEYSGKTIPIEDVEKILWELSRRVAKEFPIGMRRKMHPDTINALMNDPRLLNQFEVKAKTGKNRGSGYVGPEKWSARDKWEGLLFDSAYHKRDDYLNTNPGMPLPLEAAKERPRYGLLIRGRLDKKNVEFYGPYELVMKRDVIDRITITTDNSSHIDRYFRKYEVQCLLNEGENYALVHNIMEILARRAKWQDKFIPENLRNIFTERNPYYEVQFHGDMRMDRDVEYIIVHKKESRFEFDPHADEKLEGVLALAKKYNIPVYDENEQRLDQ